MHHDAQHSRLERPIERSGAASSLVDVLDRVLDKGVVVDAWVCASLVGISLCAVEARVVVASIDTFLEATPASERAPAAR